MKPLLKTVVALCLVLSVRAHPENIEDIKELPQSKEPLIEAEESKAVVREERCTTCGVSGNLKLNLKSPNEVLAALQLPPGAEVHTQESFESCTSEKGCAGLKVKDGRVVERFGNQDAFKAAAAADTGNEFSFHAAGNFAGGETPFWWMNQNSPFKTTGAGGGSFEKFSKSSSSFSSTGNVGPSGGAAIGGSVDLSANPFLNGEFSKLAGSFANGAAGSEAALGGGLIAGGKPSGFQSSSFESSSFSSSNKGELDLSKNPFLNGAGFGQSGFQAQAGFGAGGHGQSQGFSGSNSQFGSSQFSGSGHGHGHHGHHGHGTQGVGIQAGFSTGGSQSAFSSGNKLNGYTGSSPSPFTASTSGSNVNLIQNTQKVSEFEFDQQQQTQQNIDEAFQGTGNVVGHEHSGGELQQTCAGQGYVCVHKAQCNNGVVNMNGAGILQAKTKKQYCNTRTEICCRIEISTLSGAGSLQGSLGVGSATFSGSGSQGSGLFSSTSQGANFGSSGNNQGSFGAQGGSTGSSGSFGSSTFESSSSFNGNRGSSFGNGQIGQNAQGSFGTNAGSAQGSFGASTGSATFGVNTGSTTGSSNSFGSTTGSRGTFGSTTGSSGTSGFGSNTGFGISGSFGSGSNRGVTTVESTGFESSSSSSRDSNSFGASNGNKFGVSGTFGANGFGVTAGPSTTRFGTTGGANTNSVYKTTSQSNFIETDSFSAGSENNGVYRPGSNLKPGIPYLPPVDASISGTNVVNTVYSTQRPTTTRQPYFPSSTAAPGYLPPESESRVTLNKVPPPTYTDGELILDQNREGPRRPVQPVVNEIPAGCAAALKCTPIEYCTAEGVISNTTVVLTRDQESYRVPLTDCKDLESGRVGKCCRDPNYHDPWPTNQLGKWVPGVFGGNDGKYIAGPTTKSPAVTGSVLLNNFRQSPTTPGYNQVTTGYNTVTQKNQYEVRGQGQYTKGGQGQYTIGGGGQIGVGGQGGLQDQFTQNTQTVNQFGQKVTQGGGQLVSQGGGQLITQGGGQLIKQGGGQYTQGGGGQYTQGGGQIVTQGGGLQITQGGGQLVTQGSGQLIKQGGGQYTQGGGQIVNSGGGQLIKQGGGQYVTQGSGQIVKQGSGQLVSQGGGQLVSQGGGQLVSQGSGQLVSQGGGQLVTQGGGQLIRQGQGQIVTQGQGQIVKQGQGQYVSQGQGGFLVNQGGFGNEFSESVMRVFLQRYDGNGQCGLLNGQKPYGNRNELEVDFAEIPWQAMVLLQTNRSLLCGGVITRPDVVLTSAACVDGLDAKNVLIKGGEWKLGIDDEPLPFQIVQVKNILRHPFYKRGSLHYDAAILVLSENLRFAKNIYPICLPGADETLDAFYNGAGECIVTGWGKQVLQAHLQGSILHSINVSLINPGECQAKLSQDYPHLLEQYDEDSCACGQPTNPVNNICRVDIGSALACTMGDGHFVLRGLYSWDSGCQPGNQLAAFYKFDLEWYQWAIGLIESARFAQFNAGAGASLTNQRYTGTKSGQYTSGIKGAVNSGVKGGVKGFAKAEAGQGQFQTGFAQSQYSSSKFSEASEGGLAKFGAQLNAPLSNSFSATYSAKKVYQSEPQIITYTTKPEIVTFTTKPEIVTFTTKPEYFTYTTKPKYVSYTTKPQIISYETSGSGTNPQPQYAAVPGVTYNPSFSDVVGHTHNAKCKCLEGKK